MVGVNGLYTVSHFSQLQTLKLVSLAEAQNDDTIRRREETYEVEARRREEAIMSLATTRRNYRVGF